MADSNANKSYQVVARRFRPTAFGEVVGQAAVLDTLRSAIRSGNVPHALLFSGSRGVGKTTLARIVARAVNCEKGPTDEPCGTCEPCTAILAGSHPDVVEIDAASHNLVDDIRELRERVGFASMGARYKVYILDEVHMLTRSAFNAFLKTLEEPPKGVLFILATTELHKVPDTIRSRCQVHRFQRVGADDIVARLRSICDHEGCTVEQDVLRAVAASARGGMRDAETALERILPLARAAGSFALEDYQRHFQRLGSDRIVAVLSDLVGGDARSALAFADAAVRSGVDEREALGEVLEVLRALLLLQVDGPETGLVPLTEDLRKQLLELSARCPVERLEAMIQAALDGRERIRRLDDRRMVLELSLLRMARAGELSSLGELIAAVESGVPSSPVAYARASASPAAPSAGPGEDAQLKAALVTRLNEHKPMLVSTVEHCALIREEDGGLRFEPRTDKKMHLDRLASEPVRDELRKHVHAIAGSKDTSVRFGGASAGEAPDASPKTQKKAPPPAGNKIKKLVDRFGGQVLDVDPDEGR